MKRILSIFLCVVLVSVWWVPTAAMSSLMLLVPDNTTLTSGSGAFAYSDSGALTVTADDMSGTSVAVEYNNTVNINNMQYVHLSVTSDVPFNVALKVRSDANDVYPQITGPLWYEQFQTDAPGMNEGIRAGDYTVVLNLKNYIEYNQLPVGRDGYVYIRSIHVMAKGQGTLTVHHLAVSDTPAFAAHEQGATAAPTKAPVTTAPHGTGVAATTTETTVLTTTTDEEEGSVDTPGGSVPGGVIAAMVAAVLLIGGMIAWPHVKKRIPPKEQS